MTCAVIHSTSAGGRLQSKSWMFLLIINSTSNGQLKWFGHFAPRASTQLPSTTFFVCQHNDLLELMAFDSKDLLDDKTSPYWLYSTRVITTFKSPITRRIACNSGIMTEILSYATETGRGCENFSLHLLGISSSLCHKPRVPFCNPPAQATRTYFTDPEETRAERDFRASA